VQSLGFSETATSLELVRTQKTAPVGFESHHEGPPRDHRLVPLIRRGTSMPPKGGGGGKSRVPKPPAFSDDDVAEFRAVTGAGDAQARRALTANADLSSAIHRFLDVYGGLPSPPKPPPPTPKVFPGSVSEGWGSQPSLPQPPAAAAAAAVPSFPTAPASKRQRLDEGTVAAATTADSFVPYDASRLAQKPSPDAEGWLVSLPQEQEVRPGR